MGKEKAEALPLFHASTGCDTVSSFNGIGKKKAWETWKVLFSLTKTFQELAKCPDLLSFATDEVERFVLILYCRTSKCKFVNEARNKLFASGRQIGNIPSTQDALIQHMKEQYIKEYIFGIAHLYHNMMYPVLLHASWGWKRKEDESWIPVWATLARNWLNAVAKNLVDLHADVGMPRCLILNCVCSGTCFKN